MRGSVLAVDAAELYFLDRGNNAVAIHESCGNVRAWRRDAENVHLYRSSPRGNARGITDVVLTQWTRIARRVYLPAAAATSSGVSAQPGMARPWCGSACASGASGQIV